METIKTFLRPVIDLKVGSGHEVAKTVQWTVFSESPSSYAARGAQIKRLRKISGYSVHDLQMIFGFDYPQAIYAWDRERRLQAVKMLQWSILSESPSSCAAKAGKNAPTIDNLLVLSYLFDVNISEIVVSSNIEIKIYNAEKTA